MLFKKKKKIKIDTKKQRISVTEIVPLIELVRLVQEEFNLLQENEKIECPLKYATDLSGVVRVFLVGDWQFDKNTISVYKQKDNKRYRQIRTSGKDWLQSEYKSY